MAFAVVVVFFVTSLVILALIIWLALDRKLQIDDLEYKLSETQHALRLMCARCPKCGGDGKFATIGAYISCPLCGNARALLHTLFGVKKNGSVIR